MLSRDGATTGTLVMELAEPARGRPNNNARAGHVLRTMLSRYSHAPIDANGNTLTKIRRVAIVRRL